MHQNYQDDHANSDPNQGICEGEIVADQFCERALIDVDCLQEGESRLNFYSYSGLSNTYEALINCFLPNAIARRSILPQNHNMPQAMMLWQNGIAAQFGMVAIRITIDFIINRFPRCRIR